jgi:hypothetical protein
LFAESAGAVVIALVEAVKTTAFPLGLKGTSGSFLQAVNERITASAKKSFDKYFMRFFLN